MSDTLFSQSWYRVAAMQPRLRSHVQVGRHSYRGREWYVLQDYSTGRLHRFTPEAYQIIGLMNGVRTLDEIWSAACARLGDDMPTQDEVIALMSQLHRVDALQSNLPPDFEELSRRSATAQQSKWMAFLKNPLSITIPLIDPDRFLDRTIFLVRPLFGWFGALLWLAVVLPALWLAVMHWTDLSANVADRALSLENLILLSVSYPIFKLLHEFGHAYAVKRWGGEVHEMGVMLLVFFPVPYVNASAASAFRQAHRRAIVSAAGILVETFLAAVAMYVWVSVEPGRAHALAYSIMLTAGVSTVLFNGNPLLRFDAHYILADFLEIPNLASASQRYLGFLGNRYLLRAVDLESPAHDRGEAVWLMFFAIASTVYRITVMFSVMLFIASKFSVVGIALALTSAVTEVLMPIGRKVKYLLLDPALDGRRFRVLALIGIVIVAPISALLTVPVPSFTVAEGVIATQDFCQVFPSVTGFVEKLLVEPGRTVKKGDPLVQCSYVQLDSRVKVLEGQLNEYTIRQRVSTQIDRTESEILSDEISRLQSELGEARVQLRDLVVRSPADGVFLPLSTKDLPGRLLARGTTVGYVVEPARMVLRVVLRQADVDQVRHHTEGVSVRLAESLDRSVRARIRREIPAASRELPSMALSLQGGGDIAMDPRDTGELRALENLFQFEVEMAGLPLNRIGERVFVRFEHGREALWLRAYRGIRRMFLSRFEV